MDFKELTTILELLSSPKCKGYDKERVNLIYTMWCHTECPSAGLVGLDHYSNELKEIAGRCLAGIEL